MGFLGSTQWIKRAGFCLPRLTNVHVPTAPRLRSQIGRAGRDGSEAQCVALVDDADFVRLRSLAFSGVLDLDAVRAFLQAVFSPSAEGQRKRRGGKAATQPAGSRGRKRKAAAPAALAATSDEDDGQQGEAAASQQQQQQQQQQQHRSTDGDAAAEGPAAPAAAGQQDGVCAGTQQHSSDSTGASAGQEGEDGTDAAAAAAAVPRRFGVLAVRQLAAELDMREDSMEAVLSYLEADDAPCLRMLPATALSVKVSFYAATPEALAQQHPVVQVMANWAAKVGCSAVVALRHEVEPALTFHALSVITIPVLLSPLTRPPISALPHRRQCWRRAPTLATACTALLLHAWRRLRSRPPAWCCRSCATWQLAT